MKTYHSLFQEMASDRVNPQTVILLMGHSMKERIQILPPPPHWLFF
jgi:hypothetical protein